MRITLVLFIRGNIVRSKWELHTSGDMRRCSPLVFLQSKSQHNPHSPTIDGVNWTHKNTMRHIANALFTLLIVELIRPTDAGLVPKYNKSKSIPSSVTAVPVRHTRVHDEHRVLHASH